MLTTMTVTPFLLFASVAWLLSLCGIASLQHDCGNSFIQTAQLGVVNGFSGNLNCTEIYRYYWFIIAYQLVVLIIAAVAFATGAFLRSRVAVLALFSVATLLYIQLIDAFLSAQNVYDHQHSGHMRVRVLIAGAIMTAVADFFIILSAGTLGELADVPTGKTSREPVGNTVGGPVGVPVGGPVGGPVGTTAGSPV